MIEPARQKRLVETELLYASYGYKPLNILLTTLGTLIVGRMLFEIFPPMEIIAWIAALLFCQLWGGIECLAFRHANPGPDAIGRWQWIFFIQTAASGAAWSLGPTLLISQNSGADSAFFVGTLMSVASVAMFSVAKQRSAMVAMMVTTFLPPIIAYWNTGGAFELRIAIVLFCGMVAAIAVGVFFNSSVRKMLEAQMRTNTMLNTALGAVVGINSMGQIIRWSRHAEVVFGWTLQEVSGRSFEASIVPERLNADTANISQLLVDCLAGNQNRKYELIAVRKDSREFPIELVLTGHETVNGLEFTAFVADISERKQAAAVIEESERRFRTLIEWVPEAIAVHSNDIILYVNAAAVRLFGAASAQDLLGTSAKDRIHADFHHTIPDRSAGLNKLGATAPQVEAKFLRLDGVTIDIEVEAIVINYDQSLATLASIRDISERKRAQEEIQDLAFRDPLTRLPNRRLLLDRIKHAVASSSRSERYAAIMFIDLDKFKSLNDYYGHNIGDLLLQEVAQRLIACVRDVDTVARLGGDEFIVILEGLSSQLDEAATQAEVIARKILSALSTLFHLNGIAYRGSASIGITLFTDYEGTVDEVLNRADLAMYQAKAAGRNTLSFFDPELQTALVKRLALETELRDAIQNEEFIVYYQAQVVDNKYLSGAEALVRWNHPQRGIVAPAEFIAVAEESGVILALGRWVLRTVCAQLAYWSTQPEMANLTIAVNVSASQLRQPLFVAEVLATVRDTGANPRRLKLELTETELVYDIEDVVTKMTQFKAAGVRLSLDDFGTGYSSLSYLKRLPLDELKIDQGFIKNILNDGIDAAISSMVITLAKSMGLGVMAEGVETEAQRQHLALQGCNSCQGFLFSHPLPLAEFEKFAARKVQEISAHASA